MRVGIVGCGLIGTKRAGAIAGTDEIVAVCDIEEARRDALASATGAAGVSSIDALLREDLDVVIVATRHDALASTAGRVLGEGVRVFVEKPAARTSHEVRDLLRLEEASGSLIGVGFNHRFNPAVSMLLDVARSGKFGPILATRARYGHGARIGYESEWRMNPHVSGGGEFIDQGSHLVDLSRELLGEMPVAQSLLRTIFWDTESDDTAIVVLGEQDRRAPYSLLHATCAEWKNTFEFEVWFESAKVKVSGLQGSYGEPVLTVYEMKPEMGPPIESVHRFPEADPSWKREWEAFREGRIGVPGGVGNLRAALYVHEVADVVYGDVSWRRE